MGTPAERKALLFLALVAFLGAGVRALGAPRGAEASDAAARRALREQMNAVEAARRSGSSSAKRGEATGLTAAAGQATPKPAAKRATSSRSSRKPELPATAIDVDMASAAELEALPGIGPALALRIVEDRNYNGPFGSLMGLQRVRGIGPGLSNRLTPHVTFSGIPRPSSADLTRPH
ncbi:MAG TPA: helix-hairpin-helix domain-containing protein [Gemmatimonadaceae bacterium]|nr:helix-hairpin-helix domain-containing protein [Gemmatimonadaceae bacterium]